MDGFWFEEVYDDETGQWIEQNDVEGPYLELALVWEQELTVQALLERRSDPFPWTEAFSLCALVILNDIGGDVLTALLDVCPPLEEVLDAGGVDYPIPEFWGYLGLTELAAWLGREELLDILLRRGGNVNCRPSPDAFPVSPLEAAVWGGRPECVERLLREPGLDLSFTVHLQRLWAKPELTGDQRQCLRRVAPLVAGTAIPDQGPVPIPENFCPLIAVEMGNEALFLRLCREWGRLSRTDAETALTVLWGAAALAKRQDPPDMLLALLEVFPDALKRREGRALLALSAADCPGDARLEPWLKQLRGKRLPLSLLSAHFPGWEKDGPQTLKVQKRLRLA